MTPRIIIVDDHPMIRKGLKLVLQTGLAIKDISEAESCNALMNALKKDSYTHIVLDVILSDGCTLEIAPVIRKLYPETSIMIFTMQPEDIYGAAFRQYDINYYLSKSADENTIFSYVEQFINNQRIQTPAAKRSTDSPFAALAPRELEILHYLLNGYKTKEIAETLNLGHSTVSTFKSRIFEKTGVASLAGLFELASVYDIGFFAGSGKPGAS